MSLTKLLAEDLILPIEDLSRHLFFFEDNERSVHCLFWSLLNCIERGQKVIVVYKEYDDLLNLNYLFSKYNLLDQRIILDRHMDRSEIKSSLSMANHNPAQRVTDALRADQEKLDKVNADLDSAIQRLRKTTLGGKSIADISDLVSHNEIYKLELDNSLFTAPYDYDTYKHKKSLFEFAESIYDNSFQFLASEYPFHPPSEDQPEISAVKDSLDEYLTKARALYQSFLILEQKYRDQVSSNFDHKINELKKEKAQVELLINTTPQTETTKKKSEFHLNELCAKLDISPQSQPIAWDEVQSSYDAKVKSCHKEKEQQINGLLQKLTPTNSSDAELKALIISVDELFSDFERLDLLRKFARRSSLTFFHQKENLKQFVTTLEHALNFAQGNEKFMTWQKFEAGLNEEDRMMVAKLSSMNMFWGKAFEQLFLRYYLENSKPHLDPIEPYLDDLQGIMYSFVSNFSDHFRSPDSGQNKAEVAALLTRSDAGLSAAETLEIMSLYPISFIDELTFAQLNKYDTASAEAYFFFNSSAPCSAIPSQSQAIYITAQRTVQNEIHADAEVTINLSTYRAMYQVIDKKLAGSTLSDRHRTASYLGQELQKQNNNYKLFQLKEVSIISCLSDIKNSVLLMAMLEEGIKEIIVDKEDINLLPGILSDTSKTCYLLIEDGLLTLDKNYMEQMLLIDKLRIAGVQIQSIDNSLLFHDRDTAINRMLNKIIASNTVSIASGIEQLN